MCIIFFLFLSEITLRLSKFIFGHIFISFEKQNNEDEEKTVRLILLYNKIKYTVVLLIYST